MVLLLFNRSCQPFDNSLFFQIHIFSYLIPVTRTRSNTIHKSILNVIPILNPKRAQEVVNSFLKTDLTRLKRRHFFNFRFKIMYRTPFPMPSHPTSSKEIKIILKKMNYRIRHSSLNYTKDNKTRYLPQKSLSHFTL